MLYTRLMPDFRPMLQSVLIVKKKIVLGFRDYIFLNYTYYNHLKVTWVCH